MGLGKLDIKNGYLHSLLTSRRPEVFFQVGEKLITFCSGRDATGSRKLFLVIGTICLLLFSVFTARCNAGMDVVPISSQEQRVELGPYIQFLEDPSKNLTISEVSSQQWTDTFQQNQSASINLGITESPYWFRFSLLASKGNHSDQAVGHQSRSTEWLLSLRRDLDYYDEIQVFWKENTASKHSQTEWRMKTFGMYTAIESGQRGPSCITISLPLESSQPSEIYMRIDANGGLNFKPILFSPDAYNVFSKKLSIFYGVYYGIVISMVIYNLFHFFFLRERVRLIYIMYATALAAYFFVTNELALALIPAPYLTATGKTAQVLSLLTFALSSSFTIVFLDAKNNLPLLHRLLQAIVLVSVAMIIALPFFSYFSMLKTITEFSKITILVIILAGSLAWFRGYRPARFFLLAWGFYLGGAIVYVLNFQGLFPYSFIGAKAYQAGSGIEMVLLSLAIADRIKFIFERLTLAQKKRQKQLATLTDQLIQAEERERRRIAGVLHDSIGQTLVATKWEVKRLLKQCESGSADESMAVPYLDTCIDETRTLTAELYPRALYEFGLVKALQSLAKDFVKRSDLMIKINADNDPQMINQELRFILYRAVSELLNNVVKHAKATNAEVNLLVEDGKISVSVLDDGVGFDYHTVQNRDAAGFGLFSIQERLHRIGGSLQVERAAAGGSVVIVSALLAPAPA